GRDRPGPRRRRRRPRRSPGGHRLTDAPPGGKGGKSGGPAPGVTRGTSGSAKMSRRNGCTGGEGTLTTQAEPRTDTALAVSNLEVVYNEVILVLRGVSIAVPRGQ